MRNIIVIFLLCMDALHAEPHTQIYEEKSSWEPEDLPAHAIDIAEFPSLSTSISLKLIRLYQTKIGPNSVSRCPFYISCSNYAKEAVQKYGIIKGSALFIDRHFYRENSYSYYHYPLRETHIGVLRLDDIFYLYPEEIRL